MFKKDKSLFRIVIISIFAILTGISIFLMTKVKINYDVTEYLPRDSETITGMQILEEEFGMNGDLKVMIKVTDTNNINIIQSLLEVDNVSLVTYKTNGEYILFSVVLEKDDYSEESQTVVKKIISSLEGKYEYYMYGQSYISYNYNLMIEKEIPKIMLFIIPIILLILFLTSKSFIEPLLFIIIALVSVVINMGTNALLPNVSYMTNAIGGILQFAICMDYSIIFLNYYESFKKKNSDNPLKDAWKASLVPIISASLTTVAGFIAIMFMKYKIGLDIGLVLAKGVIVTFLTVILLMPCLAKIFDKLITKTTHKSLIKIGGKFQNFVFKTRYIMPCLAILLIGLGFFFQTKNVFNYSDNAFSNEGETIQKNKKMITQYFGLSNNTIILLDKDLNTSELIESIIELDKEAINSIISYDMLLSAENLTEMIGSDENVNTLLTILGKEKTSLREISNLLNEINKQKTHQEMIDFTKGYFSLNTSIIDNLYKLKETYSVKEVIGYIYNTLTNPYSKEEMSVVTQVSVSDLTFLYELFNKDKMSINELIINVNKEYSAEEMKYLMSKVSESINEPLITSVFMQSEKSFLSIKEFLNIFVSLYGTYLDSQTLSTLNEMGSKLKLLTPYESLISTLENVYPLMMNFDLSVLEGNFLGESYQRIILDAKMEEENDESIVYFEKLSLIAKEYTSDSYIISSTSTVIDIRDSSKNDYLLVTALSVILIFIIIGFSFKSLMIPLVLIILIEGAIFINMAIPAVLGNKLLYIGYLIVGCIQLGATIDYGILLTHNYLNARKENEKKESMFISLKESVTSIVTSGFILATAGLMLGIVSSIPVISLLGRLIGIGGLLSMFLVIIVLPQVLYLIDKVIVKKDLVKKY